MVTGANDMEPVSASCVAVVAVCPTRYVKNIVDQYQDYTSKLTGFQLCMFLLSMALLEIWIQCAVPSYPSFIAFTRVCVFFPRTYGLLLLDIRLRGYFSTLIFEMLNDFLLYSPLVKLEYRRGKKKWLRSYAGEDVRFNFINLSAAIVEITGLPELSSVVDDSTPKYADGTDIIADIMVREHIIGEVTVNYKTGPATESENIPDDLVDTCGVDGESGIKVTDTNIDITTVAGKICDML